jgi:hypothetical protein
MAIGPVTPNESFPPNKISNPNVGLLGKRKVTEGNNIEKLKISILPQKTETERKFTASLTANPPEHMPTPQT